MRKHIELLAHKIDATVYFDQADWLRVMSKVSSRTVHAAPVDRNRLAYWTALHELGHIATGSTDEMRHHYTRRGHNDETLDIEARAWIWAIENALGGLDVKGNRAISLALGSYFHDYEITRASSAVLEILTRVTPNRHAAQDYSEYLWVAAFEHAAKQFNIERSELSDAA